MQVFWPEKSRVFLVPLSAYGFSGLPRPLPDQKNRENIKNIDFYEKSKIVIFPEIVISGSAPCYHVVTDFPFYGFF